MPGGFALKPRKQPQIAAAVDKIALKGVAINLARLASRSKSGDAFKNENTRWRFRI